MKLMGGFVGLWAALFPLEICLFGSPGGGSRGVLGRLGGVPGHLGGTWGVPGGVLDRLGAVLGASWAVLGASWVVGASWGALGGVRGLLERVLSRIHAHPSGYKKPIKI